MAAFFALLAGLAIGFFLGVFFVGYMITDSSLTRKYFVEMCERVDSDDDI